MPRKKYDSKKVNIVGRFFEDLAEAIFICERSPNDEGDFHIWKDGAGIGLEVKGSDNKHEFRLPLHQIEFFKNISEGFPLNSFFFMLFSYHNPIIKTDSGYEITSLSQHKKKLAIRRFLAANMETLFIIDMAVIDLLFAVCRISDKSIPLHRGVKSLNIRPRLLRSLTGEGLTVISGGNIKKFISRSFVCEMKFKPDLLESYIMKFSIVFVGRPKEVEGVVKFLSPGAFLTPKA